MPRKGHGRKPGAGLDEPKIGSLDFDAEWSLYGLLQLLLNVVPEDLLTGTTWRIARCFARLRTLYLEPAGDTPCRTGAPEDGAWKGMEV